MLGADYISILDVSEILGKSYEWTRQLVRRGEIKQMKVGSRTYFKKEWVKAYLQKNTHAPKARRND